MSWLTRKFPAWFPGSQKNQEKTVPTHLRDTAKLIARKIYKGIEPLFQKYYLHATLSEEIIPRIQLYREINGGVVPYGSVYVVTQRLERSDEPIRIDDVCRKYSENYNANQAAETVQFIAKALERDAVDDPTILKRSSKEIGREFVTNARVWTDGHLRTVYKDKDPFIMALVPVDALHDAWKAVPVVFIDIDVKRTNKEIRITAGRKPVTYRATEIEQALAVVHAAIVGYIRNTVK